MVLRKWERGIRPIDFTPAATPVWIEFQGVPPEAITNEGVSWLASKIGKPLNKFVRDGVNIRVCVLRDRAIPCPEKLVIEISKTDRFEVMVVQPKAREYGKTGTKLWRVKSVPKVNESETQTEEGETLKVQEGAPATPIGLQIIVSDDKAPSTVVTEAGGSKSKKKKKAKKKVNVDGGASSVEGHQESSLPGSVIGSGNGSAPPLEGTEAPVGSVSKQGTGGGDNEVIQSPNGDQTQTQESEEVYVEEEEYIQPGPSGRKAQLKDYFPFNKGGAPHKQKYVFSGVKTRHKTTQR
ncbi:hypothetical protein LINPERPRIM_LOCUS22267 [Linum perenne]